MKHLLFILSISLLLAATASAQVSKVSPFHRLPTQTIKRGFYGSSIAPLQKVTAWRFTAAAASFDIVNDKVLTGIGYGFNSMHLNTDSLGNSSWYTDLTANISVYAAGNAAPTYSNGNTNIIAIGPSIGILNKLVNVGYVFYPAMNGGKSQTGIIAGVSIPLN